MISEEENDKVKKQEDKLLKRNLRDKGITLVALVVTIIVLLILAGITITLLFSENGIIKKAQKAKEETENAVATEAEQISNLAGKINEVIGGNGAGDDTPTMPDNWNSTKVTAVKSEDNVVVPVPIGFTASTIDGEKSVANGFVIKQGNDGSATSGINEFVWVPVSDPNSMFATTTDSDGNTINIGQLYDFGTSSSPKNPAEKITYSTTGYREPDIITRYDGSDATSNASYFKSAISETMTGSQFKTQLQNEFNSMKTSVETYGGFYIGRYETGKLSEATAVVQKNNSDISNQNWYTMYMKSKTIAQGTEATSSMIWGCQWDATLRWFQTSSKEEVVNFVTNSTGKGNYSGTQGDTDAPIPTGSNDNYSVNNIYDMAGNVFDWTLEAYDTLGRVIHRRLLQHLRFRLSSF